MKLTSIPQGVRYIVLSTIFFAMMNVGVKYLDRIPVHEVVTIRALVSLIVCYYLLMRAKISPLGNNKRLLVFRGITGTAALTMYFYTLQHMPLASAVTIQYLSPIFTIIIAGFLLKEPPRAIQWLFFLVSFAGVLMVKGFDPRVSPFDLGIGITAAVCSAMAYNTIRKLNGVDHPLVVVLYFPLVTVPVIGSYSLFHWVQPTTGEWSILIAIGLVVTVAQVFMTKAYQMDKAANISNFNYLGSVYALIIGYTFWGESFDLFGFGGIALIIFGVLMGSRFRQK